MQIPTLKPNTRDFFEFTSQQIQVAAQLLLAFRSTNDHTKLLGSRVTIELNPNSNTVFLLDDKFHSAVMLDGVLEDYLICGCLNEGFRETIKLGGRCCQDLAKVGDHLINSVKKLH